MRALQRGLATMVSCAYGIVNCKSSRKRRAMQSLALELAAPAIRLVLWIAPLFMAVGAGLLGASILQRRLETKGIAEAEIKRRVDRARGIWAVTAMLSLYAVLLAFEWIAPNLSLP